MIWAGVSTAGYAALRTDDEDLANVAAAVIGAGLVIGGIWWAWWPTSHGPLPADADLPSRPAGAADDVNTQLDDGEGYDVLRPEKAYGRERTITGILDGVTRFRACAGPGAPTLKVGNISRLGGGPLPPHASHRTGRDVDIPIPNTARLRWCLLRSFLADDQVEVIFYDRKLIAQAAIQAGTVGDDGPGDRVQHWKGHADHIHVRFRDE